MEASYKEKAVNGFYWMLFSSVANAVLKLLILMLLSRLLTPQEFGAVAAVQIIISYAEIFWMMGIGPAVIQKKILSSEDITTANILNIAFGLSVYILIYVFSPTIAAFFNIENINMLRVLSAVFVIHSLSGVSESLLQREMNFKLVSFINIISLTAYGVTALVFALLQTGAWALIYSHLIQIAISTILSIIFKPVKPCMKIRKDSAKELIRFGTGITLTRFLTNTASQGDYFVVNKTIGNYALGLYNRSYQMLMVPTNIIASVVDKVLFPLLSKYQDQNEKLGYVYLNITSMIALAALPITIFSLVMSKDLVRVVLGNRWDELVTPFMILISSLFFRMSLKICDSVVRSVGAVYKRLWVQAVYAAMIIGGAYIGKEWGINGVAVSTTIAIVVNYIIIDLLIKHLIHMKNTLMLKYLAPIFLTCLPIGAVCFAARFIVAGIPGALFRLIIVGLIELLLFAAAFRYIISKLMPAEFKEFIVYILGVSMKKIKPTSLSV